MRSCSEHGDNSNVCEDKGGFPPSVFAKEHPSGQPDQDWHNIAAAVAHNLQQSYYQRRRAMRALEMARRAVDRDDWSAFEQWLAVVVHETNKLRNA